MAKRKDKPKNRVRDWKQHFAGRRNSEDTPESRQSFARREVKLPPRDLSVGQEDLNDLPRIEGMVRGLFPGGVEVHTENEELLCGIAGTFRAPENTSALTVGDIVTVALTRPEHLDGEQALDKDRSDGLILSRQPRKTVLARPQPRSGKRRDIYQNETFEKVIVANVDILLMVAASAKPTLRRGLIDRFLIIAERGELKPILVINKIDLGLPDGDLLESFRKLGTEMFLCSAQTGEGLTELRQRIGGHKSVLAGASGVGKTTLINALIPGIDAATRSIREKDHRGRHTTSSTVIYDLPGGGQLVDTPGVRELGLHLDAAELPWYFPEFEAFVSQCKFRNCTHTHEPQCAILDAVERGQIEPRRYESYLALLESLEENRR